MSVTTETLRRDSYEATADYISSLIGGDVTPERVTQTAESLALGGIWVHGIKRHQYINGVKSEGICPLTRSFNAGGRPVSWWTSGWRVFAADKQAKPMSTYDTTFFHFAHTSYAPSPTRCMAVTSSPLAGGELAAHKDPLEGYQSLHLAVPVSRFDLIHLEAQAGEDRAAVVLMAFYALEQFAKTGVTGGRLITGSDFLS